MAEPFGIVAGALGIAGLFTTCVDCFEYIQLGKQFGKDYQTSLLKLDIARLRLSRWGNTVNINGDLGGPHVMATKAQVETAKDSLGQILELFDESETISKSYKLKAKPGELQLYNPTNDLAPNLLTLHSKMRNLAQRRQKSASLMQKTSWALYKGKNFARLIEDITSLVDGLEKIFPVETLSRRMVEIEITEIQEEIRDEPSLAALEDAAGDVDVLLQESARAAIENLVSGHNYQNIKALEDARMRNGDEYADGAAGNPISGQLKKHFYDGVTASGRSRVHNGDKYGGKSVLDD